MLHKLKFYINNLNYEMCYKYKTMGVNKWKIQFSYFIQPQFYVKGLKK